MYKVFIVDDEPFIIEGLYDIVDWAKLGMEIVGHAENGLKALERLKQLPVDILITDISMPQMNGLDLIRSAREVHPNLKVIVLSGYDEFAYLKEGMALGIENYLLKPINLEEFQATLKTAIDKLNESKVMLNEHSIRILRDNIMHRWIRRQIGSAEFRERADLLGISLNQPYAMVALLRPERPANELFDAALRIIAGQTWIVPFRDMDGDIVLLYNFDDPGQGKERADNIHRLLIEGLQSFKPVRISVGSVEETEGQAPESYSNAKKAQEYFMVFEDRNIICFEELESTGKQMKAGVSVDWAEYAKLLMARNREAMLQRIEEDFERLSRMEGVTPDDLHISAMEWIVRFKMQFKEIRHSEEPGLFKDSLVRIRSAGSIGELIGVLKEVADKTMESLDHDLKSPVVQQVLNNIHTSYNEDLSLKTLGSLYNIHPVYLGQLFHKEVGESFTEYINRYRIEKAKEQLRTTYQKVHEIARSVGYWETGYFYKQFKKYVGVSPTEFKGLSSE
ncbi:response regulator [Paenibacillus puldeungensis]|uniref:Response regulator n=1 Tax=Paenibacillus puldeungensis TaxID=696536 RepID=A0ABW3RTT1_9BACL